MSYSRVGDQLRAWRITGPTHNLLGIRLDQAKPERIRIERLPAQDGRQPSGIDESRLIEAVLAGVQAGNLECGTSWNVVEIAYVDDDSPTYSEYEILAHEIIRRLASGKPFQ